MCVQDSYAWELFHLISFILHVNSIYLIIFNNEETKSEEPKQCYHSVHVVCFGTKTTVPFTIAHCFLPSSQLYVFTLLSLPQYSSSNTGLTRQWKQYFKRPRRARSAE